MNRTVVRLAGLIAAAAGLAAVLAACGSAQGSGKAAFPTHTAVETTLPSSTPAVLEPTVRDGFVEYPEVPVLNIPTREWEGTNLRRYASGVDPADFIPGGVARNQIAPVYSPKFVTIGEAVRLGWLTPDHPVVVVKVADDARAYPLAMLTIHEVVNDTVGGEPVVVTYCPLCYTALAFERTVDGRVLAFGTTGTLRHSNLLMWDDASESWWQQATGEAVVGDMAGVRLEYVPAFLTSFAEFVRTHPTGTVLSPDSTPSAFHGGYGLTAYLDYDGPNNRPYLFYGELDQRLDPVSRVLGVEAGGQAVAFPFKDLEEARATHATVGGQAVVVFWAPGTRSALDQEVIAESRDVGSAAAFDPRLPDGRVLSFRAGETGGFVDDQTGSEWTLLGRAVGGELAGTQLRPVRSENGMWFVWETFRPDTLIHEPAAGG